MDRRRYLAALGTATLGSLAGCPERLVGTPTSSVETAASGPARFERVAVDGPASATAGEAVALEVAATNTGGRAGDFAAALVVEGRDRRRAVPVAIPDVPRGQRRSTRVEAGPAPHATTLAASVPDRGARHAVEVVPATAPLGRSVPAHDGTVEATVEIRGYHSAVFYRPAGAGDVTGAGVEETAAEGTSTAADGTETDVAQVETTAGRSTATPDGRGDGGDGPAMRTAGTAGSGEGPRVLTPEDADVAADAFLLADVRVVNDRAQPVTLAGGDFSVAGARGLDPGALPGTVVAPSVAGGGVLGTEVPAGGERAGQVLVPVHAARVEDRLRVGWDHGGTRHPDARWSAGGGGAPIFESASVTVPRSVEVGREAEVSVEVRNEGSAPGTARALVQRRGDASEPWGTLARLEGEVQPGRATALTATVSEPTLGAAEYRVAPFAGPTRVAVDPARLAFGEPFAGPGGVEYAARFWGWSDHYEAAGRGRAVTPDRDAFAVVAVDAANPTGRRREVLGAGAFAAAVDGRTYEPAVRDRSTELTGPVAGPVHRATALGAEERTTGWLLFDLPAAASDPAVRLRHDPGAGGGVTATWTESG